MTEFVKYLEERKVKRISPDRELAMSLLKNIEQREASTFKLNETSIRISWTYSRCIISGRGSNTCRTVWTMCSSSRKCSSWFKECRSKRHNKIKDEIAVLVEASRDIDFPNPKNANNPPTTDLSSTIDKG